MKDREVRLAIVALIVLDLLLALAIVLVDTSDEMKARRLGRAKVAAGVDSIGGDSSSIRYIDESVTHVNGNVWRYETKIRAKNAFGSWVNRRTPYITKVRVE